MVPKLQTALYDLFWRKKSNFQKNWELKLLWFEISNFSVLSPTFFGVERCVMYLFKPCIAKKFARNARKYPPGLVVRPIHHPRVVHLTHATPILTRSRRPPTATDYTLPFPCPLPMHGSLSPLHCWRAFLLLAPCHPRRHRGSHSSSLSPPASASSSRPCPSRSWKVFVPFQFFVGSVPDLDIVSFCLII